MAAALDLGEVLARVPDHREFLTLRSSGFVYLGEVYRLAGMAGAGALADRLRARVEVLAGEIARESKLRVLPLRPLVAVQAGAALLALADTAARVTG